MCAIAMNSPKQSESDQGGSSLPRADPTTKFLFAAVIIAGLGYFAWNQVLNKPAQTVSAAAKTAQDAVKGAAQNAPQTTKDVADATKGVLGSVLDTAKDAAKKIDAKDVIAVGTDIAHKTSRVGADVANEFIGLSVEEEWRYGDEIREELLRNLPVSKDAAALARIKKLAEPILAQRKRTIGKPYTFTLVEEPVMNAFAILGGNVFIYRGVLDEMKSDVAIQSVIAHEIGHVEIGHCAKGSFSAIRAAETGGNIAGAIAAKLQQFIVLGYSEDQEFESDEYAYQMQRMLKVPKADRLQFVRVLKAYGESHGPQDELDRKPDTVGSAIGIELKKHYRSHPAGKDRVARLEAMPD